MVQFNLKTSKCDQLGASSRGEDGEGSVPSGSPGRFCEGQGQQPRPVLPRLSRRGHHKGAVCGKDPELPGECRPAAVPTMQGIVLEPGLPPRLPWLASAIQPYRCWGGGEAQASSSQVSGRQARHMSTRPKVARSQEATEWVRCVKATRPGGRLPSLEKPTPPVEIHQ